MIFKERLAKKPEPAPRRGSQSRDAAQDDGLYEALRKLRFQIAKRENVPAYVVFSNATLADMALKRPRDMQAFLMVSGVGEYKAVRYGEAFLQEIKVWEGQ